MPWELVEGKLQGRGWKDCKQIGKTPNAFRWLLAAAICKILYRFPLFGFVFLFLSILALHLHSTFVAFYVNPVAPVKTPCSLSVCLLFRCQRKYVKNQHKQKKRKTKKNFFDRLQLAANFHSSHNTHTHTLTHAHTSLGRYTLCVEVAQQLSWLSAAVDVYVYVCVCVTGCACVVYCLQWSSGETSENMQTVSTAVGSDFRFHFEKNEIGCIPTEAHCLLQ